MVATVASTLRVPPLLCVLRRFATTPSFIDWLPDWPLPSLCELHSLVILTAPVNKPTGHPLINVAANADDYYWSVASADLEVFACTVGFSDGGPFVTTSASLLQLRAWLMRSGGQEPLC
jgi:hypothetical protein